MRYLRYAWIALLALPFSALALEASGTLSAPFVNPGDTRDFRWLVGEFLGIIALLVPFIFSLAFLVFLWGIVRAWIIGGGDAASVEKGKKIALAGIIGFVVMVALWGIVAFLRSGLF